MADDTHPDEEPLDVYDDYEEYVDFDEHERARAYARRNKARAEHARERPAETYDDYRYGEDSGEAFEKGTGA